MIIAEIDKVVSGLLAYIESLPLHTGDFSAVTDLILRMEVDLETALKPVEGREVVTVEELTLVSEHWFLRALTVASRQKDLRAYLAQDVARCAPFMARYQEEDV